MKAYTRCGAEILVDAKHSAEVARYRWFYDGSRKNNRYVRACVSSGKTKKTIFFHHLVLPKKLGYVVDHKNGNTLDNRRQNLRYVTLRQNGTNGTARKQEGSPKSPVGVTFDKRKGWRVRMSYGYRDTRHVAWCKTLAEAKRIARKAHIALHGEHSFYKRKK